MKKKPSVLKIYQSMKLNKKLISKSLRISVFIAVLIIFQLIVVGLKIKKSGYETNSKSLNKTEITIQKSKAALH